MADNVIVYSTPLCAPCEQVKAYLRRHGVDFVVKDLLMDEDAAERLAVLQKIYETRTSGKSQVIVLSAPSFNEAAPKPGSLFCSPRRFILP